MLPTKDVSFSLIFSRRSSPKKNVWRRLRDPQSPGGAGHKQQGVRWWSGDDGGGVFKWNFVNTHRPINQKPSKNHAAMVHRKKPLVQPEIIATHGDMHGRKLFFLLDFQGHYHLWIFLFDSNESKTIQNNWSFQTHMSLIVDLPSRELIYPTWGKGMSSTQKYLVRGYVSVSQECNPYRPWSSYLIWNPPYSTTNPKPWRSI